MDVECLLYGNVMEWFDFQPKLQFRNQNFAQLCYATLFKSWMKSWYFRCLSCLYNWGWLLRKYFFPAKSGLYKSSSWQGPSYSQGQEQLRCVKSMQQDMKEWLSEIQCNKNHHFCRKIKNLKTLAVYSLFNKLTKSIQWSCVVYAKRNAYCASAIPSMKNI